MSQITNSILMIKPTGFTYNAETAENNHFQNPISTQNQQQRYLRMPLENLTIWFIN